MICRCCEAEVDSKNTVCHICGFPLVTGQDVSENVISSIVKDTRNKYLGGVSLKLKVYNYEIKEKNVVEKEPTVIHLFDALELKTDKDMFCKDEFEDIPSSREFNVELEIVRNGNVTPVTVRFAPGREISHERLGVRLMPGFRARLTVGNKDGYINSDEFSII